MEFTIIHVEVPGVGERAIKWFGVLRPVDLDAYFLMMMNSKTLKNPKIIHMTKFYKLYKTTIFLFILSMPSIGLMAGNIDRAGSSGASELLINPWAKSSGWGGVNIAGVRNVEAMNLNIAGVAFTRKTEISFSHTIWLNGSQIFINRATRAGGDPGGRRLRVDLIVHVVDHIYVRTYARRRAVRERCPRGDR